MEILLETILVGLDWLNLRLKLGRGLIITIGLEAD